MVRDDSRGEAARDEPDPALPVGEPSNPATESHDVTRILSRIEHGEPQAAEQLLPLVYEELRKLAASKMAQEKPNQTLQATALVHEAYVRLVDVDNAAHWNSRGHFFAAAAEAMRRILVDAAREKQALRRGGNLERLELTDLPITNENNPLDLLALEDGLKRLEQERPQAASVVKLRYFAGLTIAETALTLEISHATVERLWTYARARLHAELTTRE